MQGWLPRGGTPGLPQAQRWGQAPYATHRCAPGCAGVSPSQGLAALPLWAHPFQATLGFLTFQGMAIMLVLPDSGGLRKVTKVNT